jgi:predicted membrane protein
MSTLLDSGWARGVSLLAALSLMLLITLLPRGLTVDDGSPIGHGVLTLIMWGMSAGFVHGVGFVPRNRILRLLLGPLAAWTGMVMGLFFYVQYFLR